MKYLFSREAIIRCERNRAKNNPRPSQTAPPQEPEVQRFLKCLGDLKRAVLIRAFETADKGELARKLEAAATRQLEETPSLGTRWSAYDKVVQKIVERFIEETHRLARAATYEPKPGTVLAPYDTGIPGFPVADAQGQSGAPPRTIAAEPHKPAVPPAAIAAEPPKLAVPRVTIAAEPSEWRVRLRPEGASEPVSVILSTAPETIDPNAHPPGCLAPGCGPGPLVWQLVEDAGVPGLAAISGRGRFKILHVSGDSWALFYEHEAGGWDELGVGTPEALKRIAAARAHHGAAPSTPVH